jgi:hypothetical protein
MSLFDVRFFIPPAYLISHVSGATYPKVPNVSNELPSIFSNSTRPKSIIFGVNFPSYSTIMMFSNFRSLWISLLEAIYLTAESRLNIILDTMDGLSG